MDRVSLIPLERLLVAPMSLLTLLLGNTVVRAFFALDSAAFGLLVGVVV